MKTFAAILVLAASGCLAARIETITLDLERPQQPFTMALTEATDSTVSAQLRASGSEFDPTGWTGLLWYGTSVGGQTLTNATAGYGAMTWSVPVTSMPTNGRYSVQILGAISNRVEEWGRGALVVRINPSRDFLPAQWSTNNPAYVAALQALSGLNVISNALQFAITSTVPAQISAAIGHLATTQLLTAAIAPLVTTSQLSNALASLPVPSADALRLVNSNATEWIGGDGGLWRIGFETSSVTRAFVVVPPSPVSDIGILLGDVWAYSRYDFGGPETNFVFSSLNGHPEELICFTGKFWSDPYWMINPTALYQLAPYGTNSLALIDGANHVYLQETQLVTFATITQRVDQVIYESRLATITNGLLTDVSKELHADSFTNLIWRTVWSNGWCWAIAYTNTP